jgi:hypothetical protein
VLFPPSSQFIGCEGGKDGTARSGLEGGKRDSIKAVVSLGMLSELRVDGHDFPTTEHGEMR